VVVVLQALFTISVVVASKKNACYLSSFLKNYADDDDIKLGKVQTVLLWLFGERRKISR